MSPTEQYELKAQKGRFGTRVVDGAYSAMLERLAAQDNPNLLLMNYDPRWLCVTDLIVVPKHFFTVQMIEPRKPLGPQARRAGWQGCNIRIDGLPASGRIVLVRSGEIIPKADVLASWRETLFLRNATLPKRGWLVEVMRCVERIGRPEFTLDDVYSFESELAERFPGNRNVRPKIRQQLQVLRDQGWLRFESRGRYRLVSRG